MISEQHGVLDDLTSKVRSGRMTRRTFIERAAGLGIGGSAALSLLSACGAGSGLWNLRGVWASFEISAPSSYRGEIRPADFFRWAARRSEELLETAPQGDLSAGGRRNHDGDCETGTVRGQDEVSVMHNA